MFVGSMLTGLHLKTPPVKDAPTGAFDTSFMLTVSPSGSDVLTAKALSCPTVTLKTLETVIIGLALAKHKELDQLVNMYNKQYTRHGPFC